MIKNLKYQVQSDCFCCWGIFKYVYTYVLSGNRKWILGNLCTFVAKSVSDTYVATSTELLVLIRVCINSVKWRFNI